MNFIINYIENHLAPYKIEIMAHTGISLTYIASYLSKFSNYSPIIATVGGFVLLVLSIKGQTLKNRRELLEIQKLLRIEQEMAEAYRKSKLTEEKKENNANI